MKLIKNTFLLLMASVCFCCVRAWVAPYPDYNFAPTDAKKIPIYYMPPAVQFEIIGEVEAHGAPAASWDSVEWYMRKKAATIGGDAIVLVDRKEEYAGTYNTPTTANAFVYGNYVYYTYQPGSSYAMKKKHLVGLVIKWKKKDIKIEAEVPKTPEYTKYVTVYLKNGDTVKGAILMQDENALILKTSLGELKIEKIRINTIKPEKEKVIIYLKDGSILKGRYLSKNQNKLNIETSFGELQIAQDNVIKIEHIVDKEMADSISQVVESAGKAKSIIEYNQKGLHEGDVVPLDTVDVAPVLIKSVTPKYEWRKFYAGSVKFILEVLISENGDIENAIIIGGVKAYEPVRKVLMDAVRQWKYEPALKSGVRVKVWKEETIRINID